MPVVCLHVRIYVVILFSLLYYSHHRIGGYIGWRWCYEYIHCYNLVGILDGDGDEEEDLLYWIRMAFWIGFGLWKARATASVVYYHWTKAKTNLFWTYLAGN